LKVADHSQGPHLKCTGTKTAFSSLEKSIDLISKFKDTDLEGIELDNDFTKIMIEEYPKFFNLDTNPHLANFLEGKQGSEFPDRQHPETWASILHQFDGKAASYMKTMKEKNILIDFTHTLRHKDGQPLIDLFNKIVSKESDQQSKYESIFSSEVKHELMNSNRIF